MIGGYGAISSISFPLLSDVFIVYNEKFGVSGVALGTLFYWDIEVLEYLDIEVFGY
jgi:hypothetical protein